MITIWKTPIVATVEQVLKDLKLQLYGAGLLKEIKNTGSDLMCTCPFHANGKEHNPSCGVLLQQKVTKDKTYEAGTVHCYTCGYTADNVYVLDYVKERLTFNTQLNTIIDYGRNKFPMVERIGVETVAYQKSLAQELRRLSLLPIININTSKDKVTRAMRRSANFENHKVYFREGMDDLEECLLLFPEVDHDDLFDALDFAMTMADGGNEIRVLKREDFRI